MQLLTPHAVQVASRSSENPAFGYDKRLTAVVSASGSLVRNYMAESAKLEATGAPPGSQRNTVTSFSLLDTDLQSTSPHTSAMPCRMRLEPNSMSDVATACVGLPSPDDTLDRPTMQMPTCPPPFRSRPSPGRWQAAGEYLVTWRQPLTTAAWMTTFSVSIGAEAAENDVAPGFAVAGLVADTHKSYVQVCGPLSGLPL